MNKHDVKTKDDIQTEVTTSDNGPTFKEVKVLAESGIFKNGKQYDKDQTAVIAATAAEGLEASGDVEIIGDAQAPESEI